MIDVLAQTGPELFGLSVPFLLVLIGAGLMIMEAFAPGAHFIVIGIALLAAGLVGLFVGPVLPAVALPLVLAAVVIAAGGGALYAYRQFDFYGGKGSGQTSDSKSLRGKTGRVTERVTESSGEVKLDGGGFNPYYQARALDGEIPEGEEVMVVDPGGGNVVTVESTSVFEDDIDRRLAADRERGEADEPEPEREREGDGEPA
ncbi:NfeD family protein [Natronomonas marina]|jgi:membrane protein implicated in regulation of membrane protease activity|uniref:NfeD family protein n=1 Tax=Natronomonas marina TaxID=2961939 RepID=UPI0020C9DFA9|nr:NfeD family protein [Natronomonas marina]